MLFPAVERIEAFPLPPILTFNGFQAEVCGICPALQAVRSKRSGIRFLPACKGMKCCRILLVKILTHPIASAMLCPSQLVERG